MRRRRGTCAMAPPHKTPAAPRCPLHRCGSPGGTTPGPHHGHALRELRAARWQRRRVGDAAAQVGRRCHHRILAAHHQGVTEHHHALVALSDVAHGGGGVDGAPQARDLLQRGRGRGRGQGGSGCAAAGHEQAGRKPRHRGQARDPPAAPCAGCTLAVAPARLPGHTCAPMPPPLPRPAWERRRLRPHRTADPPRRPQARWPAYGTAQTPTPAARQRWRSAHMATAAHEAGAGSPAAGAVGAAAADSWLDPPSRLAPLATSQQPPATRAWAAPGMQVNAHRRRRVAASRAGEEPVHELLRVPVGRLLLHPRLPGARVAGASGGQTKTSITTPHRQGRHQPCATQPPEERKCNLTEGMPYLRHQSKLVQTNSKTACPAPGRGALATP